MAYKAGDEVMRSGPWVYSLHPKFIKQYCYRCISKIDTNATDFTGQCNVCRYACYCSQNCQEEDKKDRHGEECLHLRSLQDDGVTITLYLLYLLKVLLRVKKGELSNDPTTICIPPTDWSFNSLLSHAREMRKDTECVAVVKKLHIQFQRLLGRENMVDSDTLLEYFGRLRVNSYELRDDFLARIGVAIYLGPSSIDHACNANTTWYSEGPILVLKAVEDINNFASVRICYGDLLPRRARKKELQDWFFFDCHCPLCGDTDEGNHVTNIEEFEDAVTRYQTGMNLLKSGSYGQALACLTSACTDICKTGALSAGDPRIALLRLTLALLHGKVYGASEEVARNTKKAIEILSICDDRSQTRFKTRERLLVSCEDVLKIPLSSISLADNEKLDSLSGQIEELLPVVVDALQTTFSLEYWAAFFAG